MTDKMNNLNKAAAIIKIGALLGTWLILISIVPFIVYAKHPQTYLLLTAVVLLTVGLTLRLIKNLLYQELKSKINTERWKENNQIYKYD